MKKWLVCLAAFVIGSGSMMSAEASEEALPQLSAEADAANEEEQRYLPSSFEHFYEGQDEYAVVTAWDAEGNIRWTYETGKYPAAQLSSVSAIGRRGDLYYLCEAGTVIALDIHTGAVLWKNSDFGGAVLTQSFDFDEENNLYLCGYLGPDLIIISPEGKTLAKLKQYDPDLTNAYRLELWEDGVIEITYEQGSDSSYEMENTVTLYAQELIDNYKEEAEKNPDSAANAETAPTGTDGAQTGSAYTAGAGANSDYEAGEEMNSDPAAETQTESDSEAGTETDTDSVDPRDLTFDEVCERVEQHYNELYETDDYVISRGESTKRDTEYQLILRYTGGNTANVLVTMLSVNLEDGHVTDLDGSFDPEGWYL